MKIKEIITALEMFAPLPLQDGFDNSGLQVGLTDAEATGALLCLDVTEDVLNEAIAKGFNLIVAHHPLLFKGLKSLTGRDYVERCVMKAVKHGLVIYAMHTNLDNTLWGVNYKMAQKLNLQRLRVLKPKEDFLLKLVTFVPTAQADAVRQALFAAGCGHIGRYDCCSYNTAGEGTFRAGKDTHPFCGKPGILHTEPEVRIETILPAWLKARAVKVLQEAHPYEEPAYDLYTLQNTGMQVGAGLIGQLDTPMDEHDFLQRVKQTFHAGCIKHSREAHRRIATVALCGGAGAFLIPDAVAAGADVFITGEIKYHDYFYYEHQILAAEIGHYESEQFTTEIFYSIIQEKCPSLPVALTTADTNPVKYI